MGVTKLKILVWSQCVLVCSILGKIKPAASAAKDYQIEGLKLHNRYRAKHILPKPDLEMDNELNQLADKCAEYYATVTKNMDHSCPYKKTNHFPPITKLGENLYYGQVWGNIIVKPTQAVSNATKMWYDEAQFWDFNIASAKLGHNIYECLHFTQVVWKNTTKLGIGYYKDEKERKNYVVALYGRMGNINGKFKDNVLPLKKGEFL